MKNILWYAGLIISSLWLGMLHGQGLVLDDEAYNKVLLQPKFGQKGEAEDKLLKIDLRPYCPPVQNQGKTNTCTGWAVGYAALSIEQAVQQEWKMQKSRIEEEAYSALFVYNQIKAESVSGCAALSSIEDALDLLKDKGNVRHKEFDRGGCGKFPSSTELSGARKNRIKEHRRLFKLDASERAKIKVVRKSLARKHPVIVGMFIKKNFYAQFGQDMYYPDNGPPTEAHAMVVVGYDDGRGRKGSFLLMNSWGEAWGNGGYIWMEYETFGELCVRAYEMSLRERRRTKVQEEINQKTEARAEIQRIIIGDSLRYQRANPIYQNLYYRFPGENWKVNDLFQINVSDVSDEKYLYAFTFDAQKQIKIHFPRDYELDSKFGDHHESSIITSPFDKLTLPEANIAFQLEEAGEEYICLLFSPEPIPDFKQRINSLKTTTKTFPRAFAIYFGDLLFSSSDILYAEEEMRYYSRNGLVEKCIPLLIKINVDE